MARDNQSIKNKGFTLIELLIALAIVGILAAIALPSYGGMVKQSRRTVAMAEVSSMSLFMEQVYGESLSYSPSGATPTLPYTESPKSGTAKYYDLTVVSTATTFTVTATPKGDQSTDVCGTLTVNQLGAQTAALASCW